MPISLIENKDKGCHFYEHFINLDNLKKVGNETIYSKASWWSFSLWAVSTEPVIFATLFGYSFKNALWRFWFLVIVFSWILAIRKYIKLEKFYFSFRIFKRNWLALILQGLPLLNSLIFTILPIWTSIPNIRVNGSFSVNINGTYLVTIYIPIWIVTYVFNHYAFENLIFFYPTEKNAIWYRYSIANEPKEYKDIKPLRSEIILK